MNCVSSVWLISLKKRKTINQRKLNCKIWIALVSSTVLNSIVWKTARKYPNGYKTFTLSRKVSKLSKSKHKCRMHCKFQWKLAIFEDRFGTKAYPRSQQEDCKIHYKVRHGVLASGWTQGCSINTWFITAELEPDYSVLQKLGMVHIKRIFPWKYSASSSALVKTLIMVQNLFTFTEYNFCLEVLYPLSFHCKGFQNHLHEKIRFFF